MRFRNVGVKNDIRLPINFGAVECSIRVCPKQEPSQFVDARGVVVNPASNDGPVKASVGICAVPTVTKNF